MYEQYLASRFSNGQYAIGWNTTAWYSLYHGVVLSIPRCGTLNTTVWYCLYHALVLAVPNRGEKLVRRVGGKILVRSNSVQSFKHLVMSGLYCHIINEIAIAILEQFA